MKDYREYFRVTETTCAVGGWFYSHSANSDMEFVSSSAIEMCLDVFFFFPYWYSQKSCQQKSLTADIHSLHIKEDSHISKN